MVNGSNVWPNLVRHEWKTKGSWKKLSRSGLNRKWRLTYAAVIILTGLGIATYFAYRDSLRLSGLWFIVMGFPYMMFFLGYGIVKLEWENDTHGWWLTLPYSRFTLVSAKCAGALLRVATGGLAVYAAGAIYGAAVVAILPHYGWPDLQSYLLTGLNWLILILGYAPFILTLGMLVSSVVLTPLKPFGPILIGGSMFSLGMLYSQFSNSNDEALLQLSGDHTATFFPFPWEAGAGIIVSWLAAYLVLRLASALVERKLSL
jgi:ABC-2 type transport system permease protein